MEKPSGDAMSLASYIKGHLESVADEGSHIDSGFGLRRSDMWVVVEGRTFLVSIQDAEKVSNDAA